MTCNMHDMQHDWIMTWLIVHVRVHVVCIDWSHFAACLTMPPHSSDGWQNINLPPPPVRPKARPSSSVWPQNLPRPPPPGAKWQAPPPPPPVPAAKPANCSGTPNPVISIPEPVASQIPKTPPTPPHAVAELLAPTSPKEILIGMHVCMSLHELACLIMFLDSHTHATLF